MVANALLLAVTLFTALCFLLMNRLSFLVRYRQAILRDYGWAIGLYAALLFANLFAAFFLLARWFFLKHTGQKLVYVDKQLRIGEDDLSAEIRERSEE
jgi:hypothetical protein